MFLPPKTMINAKYKCQKKEKVELENSMCKYSKRYVMKHSALDKKVIT